MAAGPTALGGRRGRYDALPHLLSERLTAAGSYVAAAQLRATAVSDNAFPPVAEILERALAQLDEANDVLRSLREALNSGFTPE